MLLVQGLSSTRFLRYVQSSWNRKSNGQRRRGGKRCSVGYCSHFTSDEGNQYTVYSIHKSRRSVETASKWRSFISSSRGPGHFDKKNTITRYVCDGHFTEDSFVSNQVIKYNLGQRSMAPELTLDAVPSIVNAVAPHLIKPQTRDESGQNGRRRSPHPPCTVSQSYMQ